MKNHTYESRACADSLTHQGGASKAVTKHGQLVRRFGCLVVVRVLGLVCAMSGAVASTAVAAPLEFDGRIEAVKRADVSAQINGVVTAIHFNGGESVTEGQPLLELDSLALQYKVDEAKARAQQATVEMELAQKETDRRRELAARSLVSETELQASEAALKSARAEAAVAKAALDASMLAFGRAVIRSPISGTVSRPKVALGAFIDAEAGNPLASIVQLDPVYVSYRVPYAVRLESLEASGAKSIEELFDSITLKIVLPNGASYHVESKPLFASADVDPTSGALTIWARASNPSGLLRPGMPVRVLSTIGNSVR